MRMASSRYAEPSGIVVADGWSVTRLTPPSRLYGANGLRTGADGRIYVAQVTGSQVNAIDIDTGTTEVVSPMGGAIIGPDDLAFDAEGNLYLTEFTEGRVSVLEPTGAARVIRDDLPGANPITMHDGRLFVGECRPGARIMELDLEGAAPRVILDNVPMANAMEVGPDGKLYFPVMGTNEIWRIDIHGGAPEIVAGDLGVPDAVKFDADGFIISTQVATGQVLRIDPRSGARTVLADVGPGLDNLAFVGDRLFVSRITGQIEEIARDGTTRNLIPGGFNWPLGLTCTEDGAVFVSDGSFFYEIEEGAPPRSVGMLFTPGFPGYFRGVACIAPDEFLVTTAIGAVALYRPNEAWSEVLIDGLDRPCGVATKGRAIAVAETGAGRLHEIVGRESHLVADDLAAPMGVALTRFGFWLVAEAGAGKISRAAGGNTETVVDGLVEPHGIVVAEDSLYILDVGTRSLVEYDMIKLQWRSIARNLPVGPPAGVTPKLLKAIPPHCGPLGPFADITRGADGTIYVSADAEGSILAIRPDRPSE